MISIDLAKPGWADVLTMIFITLKMTGNIAWSWWWVLSPQIVGVGVSVLLVAAMKK